ncbi:Nitrogen regulation protein C [Thiorhodovibrio winogradskyi]|uniref:Nitrogen regulation protein C n=1 Tax=Thiorhodovibrio winogradskyi TaxID=77007 RepID=A0ABZ0SBL3_9GAMM|nr:response regulator transcription factor [Thiorhodovibrio winogradskyi]
MPPTLLLCDDHRLFREGLAALLRHDQPDWEVVAQAGDGEEAIRLAEALKPDLAVLDLAMPGIGGIAAAAVIRARSPHTRIVALSMYDDSQSRERMFAAGAAAYVLKNEAGADLVAAITAVLRGETFVSPALALAGPSGGAPRREARADSALALLTAREREVLNLMARGRRTKEIANDLGISAKTVETYRSRVMLKLGLDNLADLVKFAIRAGLIAVD